MDGKIRMDGQIQICQYKLMKGRMNVKIKMERYGWKYKDGWKQEWIDG